MDIEAVNVVDYANLPENPISPNTIKNIIIGGLIGFVLVVAILVISFLMDDTIKTPDDVELYLGLSVLASIPYDDTMEENTGKKGRGGRKNTSMYTNRPTLDNSTIPVISLDDGE